MSFLRWTSKIIQTARNHPQGGVLVPNEMMQEFLYWKKHERNEMSLEQHARLSRMAEAARGGRPFPIGGGEIETYIGSSPSSAVLAAAVKSALQLATPAGGRATWLGFDISQDGALSSVTAGSKVEIKSTTTVNSTGGTVPTVQKLDGLNANSAANTLRANDTTEGTTPTTLIGFFVPVTSGLSYQFPLGREFVMPASAFRHIAITGATGVTANVIANIYWTE